MIFNLFRTKQHIKETLENPQYRIYASAANGFILVYQAHLALDGDVIEYQKARKHRKQVYEERLYEYFFPDRYYFDVIANDDDPSNWEYRQRNSENPYDMARLFELMRKLDFESKGHLNLTITEFDGYQTIELLKTEHGTHGALLWRRFFLLKDGKRLTIPENINLGCMRDFYRRKN